MGGIEIESAFDDFELFKVPIKLSESSAARCSGISRRGTTLDLCSLAPDRRFKLLYLDPGLDGDIAIRQTKGIRCNLSSAKTLSLTPRASFHQELRHSSCAVYG